MSDVPVEPRGLVNERQLFDAYDEIERLRKLVEQLTKERWPEKPEPYDGEYCQRCGRSYATVYRVPDDVWLRISPKGNEGGLLCPPCAARAAYDAGIDLWWQAAEDEFPAKQAEQQLEELRGLLRAIWLERTHGHLEEAPAEVHAALTESGGKQE